MFGTWRFDSNPENDILTTQLVDPAAARPLVQRACQSCRGRKIRCSGETEGCTRCRTLSKPCVYAQRGENKRLSRRRRSEASRQQQALVDDDDDLGVLQSTKAKRSSSPNLRQKTPKQDASSDGAGPQQAWQAQKSQQLEVQGQQQEQERPQRQGQKQQQRNALQPPMSPPPLDLAMDSVAGRPGPPSPTDNPRTLTIGHGSWSNTSPSLLLEAAPWGSDEGMGTWSESGGNDGSSIEYLMGTSARGAAHSPFETAMLSPSWISADMGAPIAPTPALPTTPATCAMTTACPTSTSGKLHSVLISTSAMPSGRVGSAEGVLSGNHHSPSLPSTGSPPCSSPPLIRDSCSCLQHITFLVHELECDTTEVIDAGLALHKEAVEFGQAMLLCPRCPRRPENLTLLTFLSERLLRLEETVIERLTLERDVPPFKRQAVVFGEYEVDSLQEWELLVSSLMVMQLGSLRKLMGRLKDSARAVRCESVYQKAAETEKRVSDLIRQLHASLEGLRRNIG